MPEKVKINRLLKAALTVMCVFTMGCVSIDKKSWSEDVENNDIYNFNGKYKNIPIYFSDKINAGKDEEFTSLIGISKYDYAKSFEVIVNRENIELIFKLLEGEEPYHVKKFTLNDELKYNGENSITLKYKNSCEFTEMGPGCESDELELFLNDKGDLIAISTEKGIGLLGIFPFFIYLKYISIYERLE